MYRQQQQFQAQHGAMDPVAARQKEEQRRKQQAYAQALAQQVQQRELQKQRDKTIERQGTSHGRPQGGYQDASGGDKGLFDGFGEKGNQNRTNFARGQRYPPATAAPSQYDQQRQVSPTRYSNAPEPRDPFEHLQHNHHFGGNGFNNPDFGFPGHGNPQLFTQPQQIQYLPPAPMGAPSFNNDWGAPLNPHQLGFLNEQVGQQPQQPQHFQHHQQQHQPEDRFVQHFDQQQQHQQYQQNPHHQEPQGQRGLRSDPSSGGFGGPGGAIGGLGIGGDDDSKARRKLQQQQEIQNALQKQVEEKNRQKFEAKKRQEDEDRREVERFEAEKRRIKQEEDKIKEEKRRKAEEELVRAQQAAIALADHQKKAQQQQYLQNQQHLIHQQQQEEQASPPRALHSHQKPNQPQYQQQRNQTHKSPQKLDPFANTRAHLFEDPPVAAVPSPQRRAVMAVHTVVHEEEETEHSPMRHPMHHQPNSVPNFPHPNAHEAPRHSSRLPPHSGLPLPPFVDTTVLLRQYDEMKAELMHQRQLVDQLHQAHAQIQIQQQQQQQLSLSPPPNASVPTLSDLEQLRNELREELEHRERVHHQELEKFRRQQEQLRSINVQQLSSPQGRHYHHLRQDDDDEEEGLSFQVNRQQNSPFKAQTSHFVPGDNNQQHSPPSSYSENNGNGLSPPRWGSPMQSSIDTRIQRIPVNMSQERELGSTSSQADLNPSSSLNKQQQQQYYVTRASSALASLQCDSKMVYFDGRVRSEHQHPKAPSPPSRKRQEPTTTVPELVINLEDSMDQLVSKISVTQRSVGVDSKQRASTSKSRNLDRELGNNQDDSVDNRTAQPNPSTSHADEDDDALAFFVKDFRDTGSPKPPQPQTDHERRTGGDQGRASGRYSSWTDEDDDNDDLSSPPDILSRLMSRNKWLRDLEINEESDDDADDGGELHTGASFTGEELEAIFQRNVRRHEILLGFQPAKASRSATSSTKSNQSESRSNVPEVRPMAWTQLHQQLEENAAATSFNSSSSGNYFDGPKSSINRNHGVNKRLQQPEDSLIASSRWMPSVR